MTPNLRAGDPPFGGDEFVEIKEDAKEGKTCLKARRCWNMKWLLEPDERKEKENDVSSNQDNRSHSLSSSSFPDVSTTSSTEGTRGGIFGPRYRVHWMLWVVVLAYNFCLTFDPSESYLVDWMTTTKGLTTHQVYSSIFPTWTYTYFVATIVFGIGAEMLGYKIFIILGTISIVVSNIILVLPFSYTSSPSFYIALLQLDETVAGIGSASFVISVALMFRLFPGPTHQKIASYSHALQLFASVTSSLMGQLLVYFLDDSDSAQQTGIFIALIISIVFNVLTLYFAFLQPEIPAVYFNPSTKTRVKV